MVRSPTQINNETEDDEADNGDDLDGCKPKFAFTEGTGAQKVDDNDDNTDDGNPCRVVDSIVPVCERC